MEQGHAHLQGRVAKQPQQLGFGGNLRGHQIQDGHAQGADILALGTLLAHDEYVLTFQGRTCGQGFVDSDGDGNSNRLINLP